MLHAADYDSINKTDVIVHSMTSNK